MALVGFFTRAGRELALRAQGGAANLTITRVGAGSGETAEDAGALAREMQSLSPGAPRVRGGTLALPVTLAEAQAAADYALRELGVYAAGADGGELLYQVYRLDTPLPVRAGGESVTRFFLRQSVGAEGLTVACPGAGLVHEDDLDALAQEVAGKAAAASGEKRVYVAPGGSDATGDGSEAAPFRTLQHAADTLPRLYAGAVTVVLRAGSYAEDARFAGICCAGGLRVTGAQGQAVTLRSLAFAQCTGGVAAENLRLTGYPSTAEGWSLRVQDCDRAQLADVACTFASTAPAHGALVFADTPLACLTRTEIANHPVAVEALRAAVHLSPTVSGAGNTVAVRAGLSGEGGASVFLDGCTLSGTLRAAGGGQILGTRAEA